MKFNYISQFKMPRYNQLPGIDLYIDQVLVYIEAIFAPLEISGDEKPLTTSMINNYVKKGIVPPTVKKKYSKVHIAYLFIVYISKQIFTIDEIGRMIRIQNSCFDIETAYNYVCDELESILYSTFNEIPLAEDSSKTNAQQRYFVRNTVIAFSNKLYTQKLMEVYDTLLPQGENEIL
ncbi:MAG: DUF1836 domain-containing protein [Oscillospiraceae bacterium]